ncbi:hypothetical protein EDB19DRAFT_1627483, partial [Suillus lakei]
LVARNTGNCNIERPKGWTENFFASDSIEVMLASSARKPVDSIKVILERVRGVRYLFSSVNDFYCFNCASVELAVVTSLKGK